MEEKGVKSMDIFELEQYNLKECPFCLENVFISYDGMGTTWFFITCCGMTSEWVTRDQLERVVEKWNKRKIK